MNKEKWLPPFPISVFVVCAVLGSPALTSIGCAHKSPQDKQVDRRIVAEPELEGKAALELRNDRALENATGLTPSERQKLTQLRDATRAKLDALSEESLKIRSLLVQDVVNPDSDPSGITLLKNKLKDTENKKVSIYLEGIDQANSVLGRRTHPIEQRERILRNLMEPRMPQTD